MLCVHTREQSRPINIWQKSRTFRSLLITSNDPQCTVTRRRATRLSRVRGPGREKTQIVSEMWDVWSTYMENRCHARRQTESARKAFVVPTPAQILMSLMDRFLSHDTPGVSFSILLSLIYFSCFSSPNDRSGTSES